MTKSIKTKEYFTINEIKEYFERVAIETLPTGFFRNGYVYKIHKKWKSGDVVILMGIMKVKIFGFFRSRNICVIYEDVGCKGFGIGGIRHLHGNVIKE